MTTERREVHVVVWGDTLWDIAESTLSPSATNAEILAATSELYEANQSVVGADPDLILPGQVLVLPG